MDNFTCDCNAIHDDIVKEISKNAPDNDSFTALSELFKMFGDKTRLKILWALGQNEMCVCDLAVFLGMTKAAVSYQLKTLRLMNLVKFDKRGKEVYYCLADDHVCTIFAEGMEHILE